MNAKASYLCLTLKHIQLNEFEFVFYKSLYFSRISLSCSSLFCVEGEMPYWVEILGHNVLRRHFISFI